MIENIVVKLKSQHRELENILKKVEDNLKEKEDLDASFLHKIGEEFVEKLKAHFELEEKEFFPKLLNALDKIKKDKKDIEVFIKNTKTLFKNVNSFIEFYMTPGNISSVGKSKFQGDFIRMSTELEIRINVEELFIYQEWLDIKAS